ncbi:hypothetical protein VTO73DRAFT_9617 [Trametes versicolor]
MRDRPVPVWGQPLVKGRGAIDLKRSSKDWLTLFEARPRRAWRKDEWDHTRRDRQEALHHRFSLHRSGRRHPARHGVTSLRLCHESLPVRRDWRTRIGAERRIAGIASARARPADLESKKVMGGRVVGAVCNIISRH